MQSIFLKKVVLIGFCLFVSTQSIAESVHLPPKLLDVMLKLDVNMQAITNAISKEDWVLVNQLALSIANHPKPSLEDRKRIKAHFGSRMREFKVYDQKTHQLAMRLSEVAVDKEGMAIIDAFAQLQGACLACHQNFRSQYRAYFYP